ncbi:hypothetical protein HDU77_011454 [Chytriomyces hyalinus]|nr:hypothetical protein HDU77_011454 [Chytriomyces hyalinus]
MQRDTHAQQVVTDDGLTGCSRTILVAVDDSTQSRSALTWTLQNMVRANDALILVHIQPKTPLFAKADVDVTDLILTLEEKLRTESHVLLAEAVREVRKANQAVKVKALSGKGDARNRIIEIAAAENVDCVVIGSRGFNKLKAGILGSVSSYLVNHITQVPVIVVK